MSGEVTDWARFERVVELGAAIHATRREVECIRSQIKQREASLRAAETEMYAFHILGARINGARVKV